ncbi:hypothetical protein ACFLZP_05040, partial [Patescibacteria group bacterium]
EKILYVTCRDCVDLSRECSQRQHPVWKTTNGGQSWSTASPDLRCLKVGSFPALLIDRRNHYTLYVGTRGAKDQLGGVYKSIDGGSSWEQMPSRLVLPDGRPYHWYQLDKLSALAQAVDGTLFGVTGGGWRYPDGDSSDGVQVWEPAAHGTGNVQAKAVAIDPFHLDTIYMGIADFGPYKSINGGQTFSRILGNGWPVTVENYVWNGPFFSNYKYCSSGQMVASGVMDWAVSSKTKGLVYAALSRGPGDGAHGGINKSTDGGAHWEPVGYPNPFDLNSDCIPYGFDVVELDPKNDDIVFAGQYDRDAGTGKLYRSTNGGGSWQVVYSGSRIVEVVVSSLNSKRVILATENGVYRSTSGGSSGSWGNNLSPSGGIKSLAVSPREVGVYVVGTASSGYYYTDNGGQGWSNHQHQDLFEQRLCQGCSQYLDPAVASAVNPNVANHKTISAVVFDPVRPNTFYIGSLPATRRAGFGVAKIEVTSSGHKWERLSLAGMSHRNVWTLAIDKDGESLYSGSGDGVFKFRFGNSGPSPTPTPTIVPTQFLTPAYSRGDVNRDGVTDRLDSSAVLALFSSSPPYPTDFFEPDENNFINALDFSWVVASWSE